MGKNNLLQSKRSQASIAFSAISIAITVAINIQIANQYLRSDGKTQALFGMTELFQFGFQYYVAILGTTALVLGIMTNEKGKSKLLAISVSLIAITLVFVRLWRVFV